MACVTNVLLAPIGTSARHASKVPGTLIQAIDLLPFTRLLQPLLDVLLIIMPSDAMDLCARIGPTIFVVIAISVPSATILTSVPIARHFRTIRTIVLIR